MANTAVDSNTPSGLVADGSRNPVLGTVLPYFLSDEEADAFIASADILGYDLSVLVKTQFTLLDTTA